MFKDKLYVEREFCETKAIHTATSCVYFLNIVTQLYSVHVNFIMEHFSTVRGS